MTREEFISKLNNVDIYVDGWVESLMTQLPENDAKKRLLCTIDRHGSDMTIFQAGLRKEMRSCCYDGKDDEWN